MMHRDSLEPAAIRFTLERLQESARQPGYFLPAFSCTYIHRNVMIVEHSMNLLLFNISQLSTIIIMITFRSCSGLFQTIMLTINH